MMLRIVVENRFILPFSSNDLNDFIADKTNIDEYFNI